MKSGLILSFFIVLGLLSACDPELIEKENDEEVENDTFFVVIDRIHNNFKCISTDQNFGELKAYILNGDSVEIEDYNDFAFQWYAGLDLSNPITDADSSRLVGLGEGNYTLVVTDTISRTFQVTEEIDAVTQIPTITLTKLSDQTETDPPNGKLEATVMGGNEWYTFEWVDIGGTPIGITGPVAEGLTAGAYTVIVTGQNGCSVQADGIVLDYTN
jgi:hypothetical protein